MKHEEHPFKKQVDKLLVKCGGFYLFEDILDCIDAGRMQSFAVGESWCVTQICEFPRRRALDIVFMVGHLDELREMESQLIQFARKHGIDRGIATGRLGFIEKAFPGWKLVSANFVKDFNDG